MSDLSFGASLLAASGVGLLWWVYWPLADSLALLAVALMSIIGAMLFVGGLVALAEMRAKKGDQ